MRATVDPTERGKKPLSLFPLFQLHPELIRGESKAIDCDDVRLEARLLCVIVGDDSGEGCSARVEWCRCVAALEKSIPRECLGSTVLGEPYGSRASSCGDCAGRVDGGGNAKAFESRGGNCNVKPLAAGSLPVDVRRRLDKIAWSS